MEYRPLLMVLALAASSLGRDLRRDVGRTSHLEARIVRREAASVSDRMCAEYAKSVFSYIDDPTGFGGPIQEDHCAVVSSPLVLGGEKADPMEFPFMVLIGYGKGPVVNWQCAGSLISSRHVLTAAHCTYNKKKGLARWALVGDLDVSTNEDDASPQVIKIVERLDHPDYKDNDKRHDIAIYRLEKEVKFSPYVRPACLYTGPAPATQRAIITGWGATNNASQSAHLQKAMVQLTNETGCSSRYRKSSELPNGIEWDKMVCAGGNRKQDTCSGDSGGPLLLGSKEYCMMSVLGVTSFGEECGSDVPGVYTRLAPYMAWVEGTVWPTTTT